MLIDYNMSKDYCSDWTAVDAIREIAQNALDSGKKYECAADEHEIDVITYGTVLTPQVFSMGVSQKDGKNAIGKYGEGFKIAMLVLTRLELNPVIFTGDLLVKGLFRKHEFTGIETFCLEIHEEQSLTNDTQFICKGTGINIKELESKVTPFAKKPMNIPSNIDIIQSRPGS